MNLTEEVTTASARLIKAGSGATIVLTDLGVNIVKAATTLVDEAWDGIDLLDVKADVAASRFYIACADDWEMIW